MKDFLRQFTLWAITTLVIFEIVVRIFGLAAHTLPEKNVDGDRLGKPYAEGTWIRGGVKELSNHYRFNNEGWNSCIDYVFDDNKDSLKIAIIGASFIEGMHTPVENSIGRQFEELTNGDYQVYEFGKAGMRIMDFVEIYNKYNLSTFHKVFINIGDKTLSSKVANKMGKGHLVNDEDFMRQLYSYFHLIRYLNINHKLSLNFKQIPQKVVKQFKEENETEIILSKDVFNRLGDNVVFLYLNNRISEHTLKQLPYDTQEIKQIHLPDDCGFDNHWNANGRKNCALAMKAYLDAHKPH